MPGDDQERDRKLRETPSQTAGPYVHIGCMPNAAGIDGILPTDPGARMVGPDCRGARITLSGVVHDGTGAPVCDAMIELWQADAGGHYPGSAGADPAFHGWGRRASDRASGFWSAETIKPGRVPFPGGGLQAPHVTLWLVARGINLALQTRVYFPDEDNADDPILSRIEHQSRVATLIAEQTGPAAYWFDIHLQGPNETVFFDF